MRKFKLDKDMSKKILCVKNPIVPLELEPKIASIYREAINYYAEKGYDLSYEFRYMIHSIIERKVMDIFFMTYIDESRKEDESGILMKDRNLFFEGIISKCIETLDNESARVENDNSIIKK